VTGDWVTGAPALERRDVAPVQCDMPPPLFGFSIARAAVAAVQIALVLTVAGCAGGRAGNPGPGASSGDGGFGIPEGTCNRKAIGAIMGGAIGGVIGAQVGDGVGRRIAILAGAAAGTLIGSHIGRQMDEADRACVGEALEKARDNSTVAWASSDGSTTYQVTPLARQPDTDHNCRLFELQANTVSGSSTSKANACRGEDGAWRLVE
jgi:surface antigen